MKLTLYLSGSIIWFMEYTKLTHCVYRCEYHVVLETRYRREVFNKGIFAYIEKKLAEITEHYPLIKIEVGNQDRDHIHIMVSIPPTMAVGKAVGIIKQNTAREMKQKFPFLKQVYWGSEGIWSDGYFVSTMGINEEVIKAYIERQGQKDTGQTKFEIN